jgi:hypothetical protein
MLHLFKNPKNIIRLGYVFVVLAAAWRWFVLPNHLFTENTADFAAGLLNGVAIGALILGIWRKGRQTTAQKACH